MTESEQIRILRENIRFLSERSSRSERQREICVSEILDRLLPADPSQGIESAYRQLRRQAPELGEADRALFLKRFISLFPQKDAPSPERSFFPQEEVTDPHFRGRIALVKNRYNEQAYRRLSPPVAGAKEYTVPSFTEACEEVANNRCEYAILPLENSRDGRLFGFFSMLDRYELRICAATALEGEDPTESTRYALIGRSLPQRTPKACPWNLEFSLAMPVETTPQSLFSVAEQFSAKLLKMDSLSVPYDDQLSRFYFTFRVPKEQAVSFHLFCSLEYSRYTPLGLYPML